MNKNLIKTLVKVIVSIALVYYSLNKVPFSEVLKGVVNWKLSFLLLGAFIAASTVWLQALRWKALLGSEVKIRNSTLVKHTWIGYFYNILAPISIGGELLKANSLGKEVSNKGKAIATSIQAKFLGVLVLFVLGVSLGKTPDSALYPLIVTLLILCVFMVTIMPVWWPQKWTKPLFKQRFENIQIWLNGDFFSWRNWLVAFGYSILIQFGNGLVHWYYFLAVGSSMSIAENFLFFPWLPILMMLPISIWGVGIKESFSLNTLSTLPGVTESQCIETSLASYLLVLLFAFIGFIVFSFNKKNEKKS